MYVGRSSDRFSISQKWPADMAISELRSAGWIWYGAKRSLAIG
jgi:hypothetical protein